MRTEGGTPGAAAARSRHVEARSRADGGRYPGKGLEPFNEAPMNWCALADLQAVPHASRPLQVPGPGQHRERGGRQLARRRGWGGEPRPHSRGSLLGAQGP